MRGRGRGTVGVVAGFARLEIEERMAARKELLSPEEI
jgi:hypothetical protein